MTAGPAAKSAAQLVAEAKQRVTNLTVDDVAAAGDPLIVDIREPAERERHGSIPGAIAAPAGCSSSTPTRRAPTTFPSSRRTGG